MKDCNEVSRELYEYLDRELMPDEVSRIDGHLKRCPSCYDLVQFESGVIKLVRRDCGSEKAPEHLKARIRSITAS